MKKYPHGLTLNAVCAAIDDYQRNEDSMPEEGILAAFNTLLGQSDIAEEIRSLQRIADTNMAVAQALRDDMYPWKQRAEAAEALNNHLEVAVRKAEGVSESLRRRAETAEAKLAELEKQECFAVVQESEKGFYVDFQRDVVAGMKLFTRPAPAVSLAELVPDEMTIDSDTGAVTESGHVQAVKWWNACRAAILRNIEEAK